MTEKEAKATLRAAKAEQDRVNEATQKVLDDLDAQKVAIDQLRYAEQDKRKAARLAVERAKAALTLSRMPQEQVDALIGVAEGDYWPKCYRSLIARNVIHKPYYGRPELTPLGHRVVEIVKGAS